MFLIFLHLTIVLLIISTNAQYCKDIVPEDKDLEISMLEEFTLKAYEEVNGHCLELDL